MKKILIVDDDIDNLEILGMLIEQEGYQAIQVQDAASIDKQISQHQPDMIIMDVMLGNQNGIDICNQLKQNATTQHIKILLMTATTMLNDHKKIPPAANGCINKPYDIDQILQLISSTIA